MCKADPVLLWLKVVEFSKVIPTKQNLFLIKSNSFLEILQSCLQILKRERFLGKRNQNVFSLSLCKSNSNQCLPFWNMFISCQIWQGKYTLSLKCCHEIKSTDFLLSHSYLKEMTLSLINFFKWIATLGFDFWASF